LAPVVPIMPNSDSVPETAQSLARLDIEHLLLPVLTQLVIIVVVARLFGILARKLYQPSVVGEIVAGLVLGPSLFGALFPAEFASIFHPDLPGVEPVLANAFVSKIFMVIAQLGLIFLLFLVGLEFEYGHIRVHGRSAVLISLMGIVVPFALGVGLAPMIYPYLESHPKAGPVSLLGLTLFLAVALSITAIPVLGKIMMELGITRTRLGAIAITAAAVDDACGWILLASVAAVVKANFVPLEMARMVGLTIGFTLLMVFVVRPALTRYFAYALHENDGRLNSTALAVLLTAILTSAIATNLIGIFAVFGAFLLGAILSDQVELRRVVAVKLEDIVTGFFVPVFFTYTGLQTDIGSLQGTTLWLICVAVIVVAIIGKLVGCGLAARASGFSWRDAGIIGAMMNSRGLMGLVAINVGYELGVIPKSLYCILVIAAVATTAITTPLLLGIRHGTEIEEPIRRSGFLGVELHSNIAKTADKS
jgi:Kef-type K+ transport system membrane component KefB